MDVRTKMACDLTPEEAKAIYNTGWWEKIPIEEAANLQLRQDLLCMPFSKCHEGMEKLLGRSVWTHEFADRDALIAEADGRRKAPESPLHSLVDVAGPEILERLSSLKNERETEILRLLRAAKAEARAEERARCAMIVRLQRQHAARLAPLELLDRIERLIDGRNTDG